MNPLDELVGLDLLQLVSCLEKQRVTPDRSLNGSWRSVVELFAFRTSTVGGAAVGHELIVDEAYGLALEAAERSGEMDAREAVIRRVNLLVVLARGGSAVRGELLRKAHVLVLDHLPVPLEVAQEKTVGWQALPIEEMRELRYVKNLLRPLSASTTSDASTLESRALDPWLALLPSLP